MKLDSEQKRVLKALLPACAGFYWLSSTAVAVWKALFLGIPVSRHNDAPTENFSLPGVFCVWIFVFLRR